jgi:hypothetical protein
VVRAESKEVMEGYSGPELAMTWGSRVSLVVRAESMDLSVLLSVIGRLMGRMDSMGSYLVAAGRVLVG